MLRSIVATGMLLWASQALGKWLFFDDYQPQLVVSDPFIELHTGPGRGYPIFYVAAQGDEITVLKRKTDWFKVRTPRHKEGWVHVAQMRSTLDLEGRSVEFREPTLDDFRARRWEVGIVGGDFGGASTLTGYAAFAFTPNISTQVSATQLLGNFSNGYMGNVSLVMHPFPEWRISPFFELGSGVVHIDPQTTLVRSEDRTDEIAHVGAGANVYITRRFMLRVEYKHHTVLTSRDDNEEIEEWKAGFSIFL